MAVPTQVNCRRVPASDCSPASQPAKDYGSAPRSSVAEGDAGAVGFDDRSHRYARSDGSAGLRLAGNGTWLAYVLATMAILLVAWCVGRFGAVFAPSPGSLYSYASMILPPWLSSIAAWSLLLAYVATASSVIGGLYQYAAIAAGKSGN